MMHNFKKRPKKPMHQATTLPMSGVTIDNKSNKVEGRKHGSPMKQQHHVYTITCIPTVKIYVEQSIDPLSKFQNSTNPPFHMKFHVKFFQPFENHFKLYVNFTSFRKYLVDRFEYKQTATLQTTGPQGYNNV